MAGLGWALAIGCLQADAPPSKYNLNEFGLLTAVKNQGAIGTCWAFADTTVLESALLKTGLVASRTSPELQLSEWHLATANGNVNELVYDNNADNYLGWGGFTEFSIGYWTRGRGQWEMRPGAGSTPAGGGAVLESNNALNRYPREAIEDEQNLMPYIPPASQKGTSFLLAETVHFKWNGELDELSAFQAQLKSALLKYGALAVMVQADNDKTDRTNPVWYGTGEGIPDHEVTLAGWDDTVELTFNGEHFVGGWYIQNSWGTEPGVADEYTHERGYFWVPFADTSEFNLKEAYGLVTRTNVHEGTGLTYSPTVVQNQIFAPFHAFDQDDPTNAYVRRGYEAGTTSLAATKEYIPSNSAIAALGVWQGDAGTTLDIRIYDGWGPTGPTGNLLAEKLGYTMNEDGDGYGMIELDEPLFLTEGNPIYVVIDFGDEHAYPILVDTRTGLQLLPEFGSYSGLSWMSSNGTDWIDLFQVGDLDVDPAIFFLKVFRLGIDLDNGNAQFAVDPSYEFTVDGEVQTARDGSANTILGLQFEDGGVLTLNGDLTVTLGHFNVQDGYAIGMIEGDETVIVPDDFAKTGAGALVLNSDVEVAGDAFVQNGQLFVGKGFAIGGVLNVTGGYFDLLEGATLSVTEWNLSGGVTDISGTLSGLTDLRVSGGALNIMAGGRVEAAQWNLTGGTASIQGVADISTMKVAGGFLQVQSGGQFAARTLNVSGGGWLNVASGGAAQVSGPAEVQDGGVIVNGVFSAEQLVLAPEALLGGAGQVFANVVNSGVVAPGNSPGVLTINGDFTQTGSGALLIEVASATVFDQLIVSGLATLDGALVVSPFDGYVLQYGESFQFLQAGGIAGTFDEILVPEGYRGRLLVDEGDASVLIAPESYTLVAATQNQRNVAAALDGFITARTGDELVVSTALDSLTAAEYPAAFNAISPAFYESLGNMGIEQAFSQGQMMQQRFRSVQLGARGFSQSGFDGPVIHERDGKGTGGKAAKDFLTPTPDNKWGVWVQGNGIFARNTSVNNVPKYNFNSGGFLGGADYRWGEHFATGLYAGYQGTYALYDGGGRTIINSTRFGGYATYGGATGFFANTMIGGGYSGYQVSRPIEFGTIDRTARSRPDGGDFETMLNLGYNWQLGNFNLGVVGTGQYTYLGIAPFRESGAESLDLAVDQQNANSLRTMLGGQIAYTWQVSPNVVLIPQGSLYWQHEFMQYPRNIGASLNGGGGPSFDYSTAAPARDSVYAGAGLTAQFGDRWNANFYYNANFGRQDFVSHMITTGLEFRW